MQCKECHYFQKGNNWTCSNCGKELLGGIVFLTSISGSGTRNIINAVVEEARSSDHNHEVCTYDVGEMMREIAETYDPYVQWEKILDSDIRSLRHLRASAFKVISYQVKLNPNSLHLICLHLSFRWKTGYLTTGFDPHLLRLFDPYVRRFINIIEDLPKIQNRLSQTAWGKRKLLELMIWRDEELFLTDLFADFCTGRVDSFAIAYAEPPSTIEKLIWHPEYNRVYLSFPITNILEDARNEIVSFRDKIREFLVVFDPYACKDYDETYKKAEMKTLQKEVGEQTIERDFRFIDQANAVVVYYPKKVPSKGVDAEMAHAKKTGKPIYLYSPEDLGGGPFSTLVDYTSNNVEDFIDLLRQKLGPKL